MIRSFLFGHDEELFDGAITLNILQYHFDKLNMKFKHNKKIKQ